MPFAQSDLVLTVPRGLAKITAGMAGVRVVEPPREIKGFSVFHGMAPTTQYGNPLTDGSAKQLRMAARTI